MKRAVLVLFVLFGLVVSCKSKGKVSYPVLGKDRIEDVAVFEDHSEALVRWLKRDIKGAVLINIDTHDDIRFIPDEDIGRIWRLVQKEDWDALEKYRDSGHERLYGIGNFIYAAATLGIVKKVYWVMPFDHLKKDNPVEGLKKMMFTYRFFPDDIATFKLNRGCFEGTVRGIPFSICDLESLPEISEPVIFSVDADYFPIALRFYKKNYLQMIGQMMKILKKREFRAMDVVVSYSVNGTYLPVPSRWVAEVVKEVISKPDILQKGYPEKWIVYQNAEDMLRNNMLTMLKGYLEGYMKKYPDDPVMTFYLATDYLGLSMTDRAKVLAVKSCEEDRGYCAGLVHLAVILAARGEIDRSYEFYKEYLKRNREQYYGLVELGLLYYQNNRADLAERVFSHYSERMGYYPTGFVVGALHLKRGDADRAGELFELAIEDAKRSLYVSAESEVIKDSLKVAIEFYKKRGEEKKAKFIEHILLTGG
ncbi:MAG: hypothetical protein D6710_03770 [Nitrospirae bacterium]|nr:MAG: hypothetical protein D6710_03770 [Nitrospirota bacterium]